METRRETKVRNNPQPTRETKGQTRGRGGQTKGGRIKRGKRSKKHEGRLRGRGKHTHKREEKQEGR